MRIFVSTPIHGWSATSGWIAAMDAFRQLCKKKGHECKVRAHFGVSNLILVRNLHVHEAFLYKADRLLTFDSDQYAPPETLMEVCESEYDVCAAPVPKKCEPLQWNFRPMPGEPKIEGDFMQVAVVGSGAMAISRKCLLDAAYCSIWCYHEGCIYPRLYSQDVVNPNSCWPVELSEDYSFCRKLQAIGYPIWIYWKGQVAHMGVKSYTGQLVNK